MLPIIARMAAAAGPSLLAARNDSDQSARPSSTLQQISDRVSDQTQNPIDYKIPPLASPTNVERVRSNATWTSLIDQVVSIAQSATAIVAKLEQSEQSTVNFLRDENRRAREDAMEARDRAPISTVAGQQDADGRGGILSALGGILKGFMKGPFLKMAAAVIGGALTTFAGFAIKWIGKRIVNLGKFVVSQVTKIGSKLASGIRTVFTSIGKMLGLGAKSIQGALKGLGSFDKSGGAKTVSRSTLAKLVAKQTAARGLKAIPIVGGVIGVGFAAYELSQGDMVGAGLSAASTIPGIGFPATAIDIAREVYKAAYNENPEDNPEVAKRRLAEIADVMQNSDSAAAVDNTGQPTQYKTPTFDPPEYRPRGVDLSAQRPAPNSNEPFEVPEGDQQTATPVNISNVPLAQMTDNQSMIGSDSMVSNGTTTRTAPSITGAQATMATPAATVAQPSYQLAANEYQKPEQEFVYTRPKPSLTPTTKQNASGVGDVPSPAYTLGDEYSSMMYFDARTA